MYERNYEVLRDLVARRGVIRHISKHRNPDGTFDLEGNKRIWNAALALFDPIPLWADGAPGYDPALDALQPPPSLIFIPAQNAGGPRGTVVVAHGGGFESRTGCEGMNVALYFAEAGFNTAVLTYRLKPYTRFDAIADMQRAIRLLRQRGSQLGITDKVAAMGFSAGGMLSANCATHYDEGYPEHPDEIERFSCRPDAVVVGYGALDHVCFPRPLFHHPFDNPNIRQERYLAPEVNVTCDTPPFFIWQTNGDDPRNAFALGAALTAAGVPFELHCFPEGPHGLALADGENDLYADLPHVRRWAELCTEWLRQQGL